MSEGRQGAAEFMHLQAGGTWVSAWSTLMESWVSGDACKARIPKIPFLGASEGEMTFGTLFWPALCAKCLVQANLWPSRYNLGWQPPAPQFELGAGGLPAPLPRLPTWKGRPWEAWSAAVAAKSALRASPSCALHLSAVIHSAAGAGRCCCCCWAATTCPCMGCMVEWAWEHCTAAGGPLRVDDLDAECSPRCMSPCKPSKGQR